MPAVAVGIDLGTTNSCIGVVNNKGEAEIIEDFNEDLNTTPSCVLFQDNKTIVGRVAQDCKDDRILENMVYEIKRLIGLKYKAVMKNQFAYNIESDDFGEIRIKLSINGKAIYKYPYDVSAEILKKMIEYASEKLQQKITKAVITIPSNFNNIQREVTKRAASLAGIEVLQLLHEPTAGALNYVYSEKINNKILLVYDLGGVTFDIAIVQVENDEINMIKTDGDNHLGGTNFDSAIVDYACKEIAKSHRIIVRENIKMFRELKNQARILKEKLSNSQKGYIILDGSITVTITREIFESMIKHHLEKTIEIIRRCLLDSGLTKNDINEIILIGGSSSIPAVSTHLQQFFERDIVKKSEKPEEDVAKGAAIKAKFLVEKYSENNVKQIKINDVIPFSLGIGCQGMMSFLIAKNTNIPTTSTKRYTTCRNNQHTIKIQIFQGESDITAKNIFLGQFQIDNITPMLAREVKVDVKMHVDESGLLRVTATEKYGEQSKELTIKLTSSNQLENNSYEQLEEDVSTNYIKLRNNLIAYCQEIIKHSKKVDYKFKFDISIKCNDTIRWAKESKKSDVELIQEKFNEIKRYCKEFLETYKIRL